MDTSRIVLINWTYRDVPEMADSNIGAVEGAAAFGVMGALIGSEIPGKTNIYRYKINYRRGNAIPVE